MAVTAGTTFTTVARPSGQDTTISSHVVDANTTLLLVSLSLFYGETIEAAPVWNTSETMTLIRASEGAAGGDASIWTWGLINPTATTADVFIDHTFASAAGVGTAANYLGTDVTSVAVAAPYISEEINTGASPDTVTCTTGGNSGNGLYAAACSATTSTATNDSAMTERVETDNGGMSMYVIDDVAGAPSGVIMTFSNGGENAGHLIELVAAAGGSNTTIEVPLGPVW